MHSYLFFCGPVAPERTRQHYRDRKRSKDRKRSQDRNRKQSTIENLASVLSTLSTQECDERCESMPPLSPAYKVRDAAKDKAVVVSLFLFIFAFQFFCNGMAMAETLHLLLSKREPCMLFHPPSPSLLALRLFT